MRAVLVRVQNELFDLGADLSVPMEHDARLRVTQEQVDALERDCDAFNAELPELKSFVLPGGSEAAAQPPRRAHVCRRAEREALTASEYLRGEPARARVPEPTLRPPVHPRSRRERGGRSRGAALEAWELVLAFAASFVAGYFGLDARARPRDAAAAVRRSSRREARSPLREPTSRSPLRRPERADCGTRARDASTGASSPGLLHRRRLGAVAGALLADDVSEALLYGLIAAVLVWSGIDLALRPIAPRPRDRLGSGAGCGSRLPDRSSRRRGRSDSRDAAHAGARALGWARHPACGRHEPRRRLLARRRRLRDVRRRGGSGLDDSRRRSRRRDSRWLAGRASDGPRAENTLRLALGFVLVVVGAVFAVQASCRRGQTRGQTRRSRHRRPAPVEPLDELVRRPRARDVEALRVVAAPLGEHAPGVARLDAFGDDAAARARGRCR